MAVSTPTASETNPNSPIPAEDWGHADAKRVTKIRSTSAERATVLASGLDGLDAAAVAGTDPRVTRLHLWQTKVGERPRVEDSERERRAVNIAMVEPVLSLFAAREHVKVRRTGLLRSKRYPWMVAVVDGLTADGGQVEVTTTIQVAAEGWGTAQDPSVPAHILTRIAHDLMVTGRSHAYAVCLVMDTRQLLVRRVERHDLIEIMSALVEAEREFWHSHVLGKTAPPLTALDKATVAEASPVVTLPAPRQTFNMAALRDQREALDDEIAELQRRRDEIDAALVAEIGEHEGVVDAETGELIATRKHDGQFDAKTFRKDHPSLAARFAVPATTLDWRSLLKDHPEMVVYKGRRLMVRSSGNGKADPARSLRALFRIAA